MSDITSAITTIKQELTPFNCQLVAVSKTKPLEDLQAAYEIGQRIFGENKVQELVDKHEKLPKDIKWHFIGHLQRNKVKYLAPFVNLIHGVDSLKLLKEINKRAKSSERVIDCLLQVHIAQETTKFGLDASELVELLESDAFKQMEHIRLVGLMGMATNTDDDAQVRQEFQQLKQLFEQVKTQYTSVNIAFTELSMGMSGDYKIALEEGSTLVRLGSLIFGARNYA